LLDLAINVGLILPKEEGFVMGKPIRISLQEAVGLINDGDCIAFSGFTIWRRPVAMCYEILRQGKKDLHLFEGQGGYHSEVLIEGEQLNCGKAVGWARRFWAKRESTCPGNKLVER
jgi:hypothetical protein